jgi:hypothetical protein
VLDNQVRLCFNLAQPSTDPEEGDFIKDEKRTADFIGNKTRKQYIYQRGTLGFQRAGSYCKLVKVIPSTAYQKAISELITDQIISDQLMMLSLEFVSYEASQDVHSLAALVFKFPEYGSMAAKFEVSSLRLSNY